MFGTEKHVQVHEKKMAAILFCFPMLGRLDCELKIDPFVYYSD